MDPVMIHIPGKPQPKQRARTVRRRGGVQTITPNATKKYESRIKFYSWGHIPHAAHQRKGPMRLDLIISMPRPKRLKNNAVEWHICTPDASNILKAVEDALNDVAYRDDSQVCMIRIAMVYHGRECELNTPRVQVVISEVDGSPDELFQVTEQGEIKWQTT